MPPVRASALVVFFSISALGNMLTLLCGAIVFFSICALGNMLTLLGGAKATRVSWEQGLSDMSVNYCDYMLKDIQLLLSAKLNTLASYHLIVNKIEK